MNPPGARLVPGALALLAGLSVLLTLGAPGITVDEPLDVRPGRVYLELLVRHGWAFLTPHVVTRTYRDNAEHPPLGRWLLGSASKACEPLEILMRGEDPTGLYVRSGRVAPALAFAVLVFLVARAAHRSSGAPGALAAGLALILMPRVFAHAHLAALDTFVALFWTLAWLSLRRAVDSRRIGPELALAGVCWGLALLTKIHGWLLAPVAAVWLLARWPWRRALLAMFLWTLYGVLVFLAGWPWLWFETGTRLPAFFRTGVERVSILVTYFGAVYRDVDVPWHFPWVYAATTVPLGLLLLGALGLVALLKQRVERAYGVALVGTIAFWLLVFSTRVPVYDGERLYLPVFAFIALAIGRGFACGWHWMGARAAWQRQLARAGLMVLLATQSAGIVTTFPFGLSYYNLLVGGLPGAERLGLELTYWGDTVDDELLEKLAQSADQGARAVLVPTLAPGQGLAKTIASQMRAEILLADQQGLDRSDWAVVYRRPAYWPPGIAELIQSKPVWVRERQGVWLSGIWRRTEKSKD